MGYVQVGSARAARGIFGEYISERKRAQLSGIEDDLFDVIDDVVDAGSDAAKGGGGKIVEDLLRSGEFEKVLDAVEESARDGVKAEVGKNALGLLGIGLGAGALGGAVLQGKIGVVGAGVLVVGSVMYLMSVNAPAPAKKKGK